VSVALKIDDTHPRTMTLQGQPEAQAKECPSTEPSLQQWFGPEVALTELAEADTELVPAILCDPGGLPAS
jgi:hypothetical protein